MKKFIFLLLILVCLVSCNDNGVSNDEKRQELTDPQDSGTEKSFTILGKWYLTNDLNDESKFYNFTTESEVWYSRWQEVNNYPNLTGYVNKVGKYEIDLENLTLKIMFPVSGQTSLVYTTHDYKIEEYSQTHLKMSNSSDNLVYWYRH